MDKELNVTITIETIDNEVIPNGKLINRRTETVVRTRLLQSEVDLLVSEITPVSDLA